MANDQLFNMYHDIDNDVWKFWKNLPHQQIFLTPPTRAANSNLNSKELDHFAELVKFKFGKMIEQIILRTRKKLFEFIRKIFKLLKK